MLALRSFAFVFAIGMSLSGNGRAEDGKNYFVFLTTGKSTQGVAPEAIQQKQAAHLENFGRLAKLGFLIAAGPCGDPGKITRGIVVLKSSSLQDAESMFTTDPYVSEGFMRTEIHQYRQVAGKILLDLESNSLEQSVIVILKQGSKWPQDKSASASTEQRLTAYANENFASKKLAFAALFTDQSKNKSNRVGVMIFRGKDLSSVKSILEEHSLVKEEVVSFEAFPQFLAKRALGD